MSFITKSFDISMNSNIVTSDAKDDKNIFYTLLQNKFDSTDRESFIINNNVIKLNMKNNVSTSYNCSGNVKIDCVIPKSEKMFPNYVNVVLNSTKIGNENTDLMTILTSFITNPKFLTTYAYTDTLKSSNDVPLINLSTILDSPNLCWNWNAGRNFTPETCRDMSNYYMSRFNELIDYIITNDLVKVDDNFNKLFVSMFANNDDKIFVHSNGSLVLPSLVNWMGVNALDICGYVKQGSKIFPLDSGVEWDKIEKWSDKEDSISPIVNVPKNFNNSITKSKYNYPFNTTYQRPEVIPTPKVSVDYTNGVNVGFRMMEETVNNEKNYYDVYDYERSISNLKKLKYASRIKGQEKSITLGSEGTDTLPFTITVGVSDLYDTSFREYDGDFTTHPNRESSGKWAWCNYYRADTVTLNKRKAKVYLLKSDEAIKNIIKSKIPDKMIADKSSIEFIKENEKYIVNVSVASYNFPDNFKQNFVDSEDADKEVYKICEDGYKDKDAGCHYVSYQYGCVAGHVGGILGLSGLSAGQQITITTNITYNYNTKHNVREYTGTYGKAYDSKIDVKAICMYETKMDLYFFNENVFSYWVHVIKNSNNQQLVLNELRNYIKNHLELVLLNKVNQVFGKYVRKMSENGDGIGFTGIPLGPPLISIPSSYVIDHKNYYPSFKVDNSVDTNHIKYDKNKLSVDIINTISCEKTNNFLDVWFRNVINSSRNLNGIIDENTYSYFVLPSKGYQLFEVIDKSITTLAPEGLVCGYGKFDDTTSMIFDFNTPKCIVSMKDFSSDTKLQSLMSSYKFICSVSIPKINLKQMNSFVEVSINTLSDDKDNQVYIYISSDNTQELISSLKGVGSDEKDKNIDKNNINNKMINIQYNGVDSNKTPICLQLHFI